MEWLGKRVMPSFSEHPARIEQRVIRIYRRGLGNE